MFNYFEGKFTEITPATVTVDCCGVGYQLQISLNTYSAIKDLQQGRIYAQLIVREDAQLLFGFADISEKELFNLLITVSGVGANTARMILSSLTTDEVYRCISSGNASLLQGVKGIGSKTAQRIILDLKDKIGKVSPSTGIISTLHNTVREEALSALLMLGFQKNPAIKVIDGILMKNPDITVEMLIKEVLRQM